MAPFQMSQEKLQEKKAKRREQNKRAAQKSRQKKRDWGQGLIKDYQRLQSSNTSLRYQISQLQKEKAELSDILSTHMQSCNLQVPTSVLPPVAPPGEGQGTSHQAGSILPSPHTGQGGQMLPPAQGITPLRTPSTLPFVSQAEQTSTSQTGRILGILTPATTTTTQQTTQQLLSLPGTSTMGTSVTQAPGAPQPWNGSYLTMSTTLAAAPSTSSGFGEEAEGQYSLHMPSSSEELTESSDDNDDDDDDDFQGFQTR